MESRPAVGLDACKTFASRLEAENRRHDTNGKELLEQYASPQDLDEEKGQSLAIRICGLLRDHRLSDEDIPKLIGGIVLHLCDSRPAFNDRACVLAAALFKRDDFDIKSKGCYGVLAEYLPAELTTSPAPPARASVYERKGACVGNGCARETGNPPLFIQQAIKILRDRVDPDAMRRVHGEMRNILGRTSKRSFHNHCRVLYKLLLDLSTPALYDEQFKSLAHLISQDLGLYDSALSLFFESRLETLQFYIIYVFNLLHELVPVEQKITIHLRFTEAFISHPGVFGPAVQKEIEMFVGKGIMLLGMR